MLISLKTRTVIKQKSLDDADCIKIQVTSFPLNFGLLAKGTSTASDQSVTKQRVEHMNF
jgi:hypothetical protein